MSVQTKWQLMGTVLEYKRITLSLFLLLLYKRIIHSLLLNKRINASSKERSCCCVNASSLVWCCCTNASVITCWCFCCTGFVTYVLQESWDIHKFCHKTVIHSKISISSLHVELPDQNNYHPSLFILLCHWNSVSLSSVLILFAISIVCYFASFKVLRRHYFFYFWLFSSFIQRKIDAAYLI